MYDALDGDLRERPTFNDLLNNTNHTRHEGSLTNQDGFAADIVPEPSTLLLLAMGAVGLMAYAWRRRKRAYRFRL